MFALVIAAASWLAAVLLGISVAGDSSPEPFDLTLIGQAHATIGRPLAEVLVSPTNPPVVYSLIAILVVVALVQRRWGAAMLAIGAPVVAVGLTEVVLKPAFDRRYYGHLSYPSGHTVGTVSALTVALLLVLASTPLLVRVLAWLVWLALIAALTTGLVAMNYHYPTDALGGLCLALGVVLPGAILADRWTGQRTRGQAAAGQATEPEEAASSDASVVPPPRAELSPDTSRDSATSRETARRYFLR